MHKSFVKLLALVTVALGLISTPIAIAQVITTSSLNGTVRNDQGQPVANATITVTHEPTGSVNTTTARADGTFVLRGLRPGGPYTITSTAPTFAKSEVREVYLDIDTGADVNVSMRAEVVQLESFQVTASAADTSFDPNQTGAGSYLNSKDIRDLPGGDRSINSLARLDPRISYNRDPQDRAISVAGVSNRYNSIQVDGVSASDPFGLNSNNTAAERNVIPLDSLDALAVNTSPYNSRNGGFVGAQINAITKSGTNTFHGSAYYTYRGRTLNGFKTVSQDIDEIPRPIANFTEETFGYTLSGPILKKKLFFSLSNESVREDRVPPSPVSQVPQTVIDQITAKAIALGFKPGSEKPPASNRLTDDNILAKVDWVINADHRATFRYNNVESSRPTFPGFGSGISENNFSYDSSWYQQDTSNKTYFGQLVSRWSDKLNTEVSYSRSKYHSEPKNSSKQPYVQIRNVDVPGSTNTSFVTFGTEQSRHANILDVKTDTAEAFASYELNDKMTLQAGVQYENADIYNLFVQNAYGFYDFNNLAQFLNYTAGGQYRTYTYNQILSGVEPAALFSEANIGLYVNDTWRITPNFKVDIGARVDMAKLPDAIPYNSTFDTTFGVRNDSSYDGKNIFQPRVGFNWQPDFGGKKTTIRGGAGLFYGKAPRVWISNSYSNTGLNYRTWSAGTNPAYGTGSTTTNIAPTPNANPDAQAINVGSGTPAMQVAFMDPNFQLPSKWKANLALERELPFWDLKASLEIEQMWTVKDVFYQNINIVKTATSPDGREMYFNNYVAATQNTTSTPGSSSSLGNWSGSNGTRLLSNLFTNRIIKVANTDKGDNRTIAFSVERPRKKDGWYWKASYVRTNANEVLFGTSSVAASNWQNRSIYNANSEELATASLEVKDKILINVTKDFEFFKGYRTTTSLLYEGRSGYPYSLVYTNDANGDSVTQNDLIYVPKRGDTSKVRFGQTIRNTDGVVTQTAAEAERLFYQIVDRFGLQEGQAVNSNSLRYPWVNQFDFSVKQEVPIPGWRHKLVLGMDILNLGNLLNSKWGIIRGSNQFFVKREGVAQATYDGATNQWVYNNVSTALANGTYSTSINGQNYTGNGFAPSLGRGEPAATRWSILFSARYEF